MRIIPFVALAALTAACAPAEPKQSGPAPLPAHPVGEVSKPTALPPVSAPDQTASASQCGAAAQNGCK